MNRVHIILASLLLLATIAPLSGSADPDHEIIPLVGELPDWWNEDVRAAASIAGAQGLLYNPLTGEYVDPEEVFQPKETAPAGGIPFGAPDYLFIRPGSLGIIGGICTYNFIYGAGTQIGTAGHCVDRVGDEAVILATPAPTLPLITVLGVVDSFRDGGVGDDWALIDIYPQWQQWVDPNMAYWGGPACSAWGGVASTIKHAGHGIQTGLVAAVPRIGTASGANGRSFTGLSAISGGDSGSPIIQTIGSSLGCSTGAAAGIITHCASFTGNECLPLYWATDIRSVPATVTVGFDPL